MTTLPKFPDPEGQDDFADFCEAYAGFCQYQRDLPGTATLTWQHRARSFLHVAEVLRLKTLVPEEYSND